MLKLVLHEEPLLKDPRIKKTSVSNVELVRGGPSWTLDTVTELIGSDHPDDSILAMGMDSLINFHHWHNPQDILDRVGIGVVNRGQVTKQQCLDYIQTQFPQRTSRFSVIQMAPIQISSTEIRDKMGRGEPIQEDVPPYIKKFLETGAIYA